MRKGDMTWYQMERFVTFCKKQHDEVCNQKYDGNLPYSKHLDFVWAQAQRFIHLVLPEESQIVKCGCYGHDLIEDARITFNDIVEWVGENIAEIIYSCTEVRGHNRDERHDIEGYYKYLAKNRLGIFVKLSDIMANVTYSILTKSSMYDKHKKEHLKTKQYLYREEFKDMFDYLDKLFSL